MSAKPKVLKRPPVPFLRSLLNGGNPRNATSRKSPSPPVPQSPSPPVPQSPSYEVCSTGGTPATQLRASPPVPSQIIVAILIFSFFR